MANLLHDLLEAWGLHNAIHLFILDWIPEEGLRAVTLLKTGKPSTGRNVARVFAHLHEVRCSRLEREPAGAQDLPRFAGSEVPSRTQLSQALALSGERVAAAVRAAVAEERPIKGWKRSPVAWIAYLISHESHHRGQIALALKQSGFRPPDEVAYGVWGFWGGYPLKTPRKRR